jgi:hypothetical protein
VPRLVGADSSRECVRSLADVSHEPPLTPNLERAPVGPEQALFEINLPSQIGSRPWRLASRVLAILSAPACQLFSTHACCR